MTFLHKKLINLLILLILFAFPIAGHAQVLRLAVAANFVNSAKELVRHFSEQSGYQTSISSGSTGKFYAQITQGAPFDVFLAADRQTPEKLVKEGLAVDSTLFDYARGKLVFVTTIKSTSLAAKQVLQETKFNKLSVANPELAPYGKAAIQTLDHMGLRQKVEKQIVMAENIGQAAQFVLSGNAQAGFLPLSMVLEAKQTQKVEFNSWTIPTTWYSPIIQSAVILKKSENNAAAIAFMKFLQSEQARRMIESHGYD